MQKPATIPDIQTACQGLSAYVDAFHYEPANIEREGVPTAPPPEYVCTTPTALPQFISAFALGAPQIIITPGPTTMVCKGVGCGSHTFLELESFHICGVCQDSSPCCRFCWVTVDLVSGDSGGLCFPCYAESLVGPTLNSLDGPESEEYQTGNQLRKALNLAGI